MTVQYRLREDVAAMERAEERLTTRIEEAERTIVDLRRQRDELRFHRAEARIAAEYLDNVGFKVERDAAGVVTVSIEPRLESQP